MDGRMLGRLLASDNLTISFIWLLSQYYGNTLNDVTAMTVYHIAHTPYNIFTDYRL